MTAKKTTTQDGYAFVSNMMQPYSVKEVNARKVYEITENLYIAGLIRQMENLILPEEITISVYNENDDLDERLSRKLNRMFSGAECSITAAARSAVSDLITWGIAPFNWVWKEENGEIVCKALHHLNPYTFRDAPLSFNYDKNVAGRLLKGISYSLEDKRMHYFQNQSGKITEIARQNLFIIRDPASVNPDGDSLVLPIAETVDFLGYAWNALAQQMYRTGAPILFITVKSPRPARTVGGVDVMSDIDYANTIVQNWGKDTPFTLRENMTVSTVEVKEGSLAIETITKAGETIRDYISPVGMLGKDGSLISGSSESSLRLVNNNIRGWATLLKNSLRELPNYYLDANGYPETWHAEINIPAATIEDAERNREKARLLYESKTGTVNEIRELLGLEGISAEEMKRMREEWKLLEEETA